MAVAAPSTHVWTTLAKVFRAIPFLIFWYSCSTRYCRFSIFRIARSVIYPGYNIKGVGGGGAMALKRLVHKQHRVKRARPNTYHWTGHTSNQSLWQRFGRPSSYNMCNNTSCTAVPVKQWNAFRGLFVYVVPYHVELHISRQHALYTQYRYTENRTRGG